MNRGLLLGEFIVFFDFVIFLCGCSSSYPVRSPAVQGEYSYRKMNEDLKRKDVNIELKDGKDISARDVAISGDSVSWLDARAEERSGASVGQIRKIVRKNHALGLLEGLGFGLVGGGGMGVALGASLSSGSSTEFGSGFGAFVGLLFGGGAGTILGLMAGAIAGHTYNYEFPTTERSDSLQQRK